MKKTSQPRPQHFERVEHHAPAGLGVCAAGHFHHHHAADGQQPGDVAAFRQKAASAQPTPQPKINRIVVDDNGRVFLNDESVPDDQLREKLTALKAADPDPKVVVKGSDAVDYQSMIKVLDALQQLDITKVGLATQ